MSPQDVPPQTFAAAVEAQPPTPWQISLQRARRHRGLLIGGAILLALVFVAVFAPLLAPHDPSAQSLAHRLLPPAWEARGHPDFLLGTDQNGRDYLSRLIYGTRVSLMVGFGAGPPSETNSHSTQSPAQTPNTADKPKCPYSQPPATPPRNAPRYWAVE